jgi:hypothetical protein
MLTAGLSPTRALSRQRVHPSMKRLDVERDDLTLRVDLPGAPREQRV